MPRIWCGMSLPWGPAVQTLVSSKDDKEVLRSSVFWILLTRKRERRMRPDFGTSLPDMVHEPNDARLVAAARTEVQQAIMTYETNEYDVPDPRIAFVDLKAVRDGDQLNIQVITKNVKDPMADAVDVVDIALSPSYYAQGGTP